MSEVICEDWNHMKAIGIEGATIQFWPSNQHAYALNNLAFARCGWYDNVDPARVLDDFLLGAYGSVANEIRPIYESFLQSTRDYAKSKRNLRPNGRNITHFLNNNARKTIRQALDAARSKTTHDREQRQVKRLSAAFRYWEMALDFTKMKYQAERLEKSDPKKALASYERLANVEWPKILHYMNNDMPPGWLAGNSRNHLSWRIHKIKNKIKKLRSSSKVRK